LVDNGSVDGSLGLVHRRYPEVETIPLKKNMGFAAANNVVIRSVNTEYVALLNPDTIPDPRWLEQLVRALEKNPQAGSAASKMLLCGKPNFIDRAGDVYTTAGTALLKGRGEPSNSFNQEEWVFGACAGAALYRRCLFEDVGLFDEDFFLLYEDVDLSFRSQLAGYKCIYAPEAIVYHIGSSSIGDDTPTSVYYSHRNLEWVFIKNMPSSLIKRTIVPHIIYNIAAGMFFISKGRGGDCLRAKWDAFKGIRNVIRKRHKIQENKKVVDGYIWNLLEKEHLLPRLTRRLKTDSSS
jgi:hypothetical protein